MTRQYVLEAIRRERIIAIVRGVEKSKTLAAITSMYKAGIRLVEVTCNTEGALDIIRTLRNDYGDSLCVGAGTVLDVASAKAARDAGASFILSPDTDPEVIAATRELDMVSVPGSFTPSELRTAMRAGADIVKIFPAGAVGPDYIKDLLGPLNTAQLMAVGGVGLGNVASFFRAGVMSVGLGGALFDKKMLADDDMVGLGILAKRFIDAVEGAQGGAA